MKKPNYSDLLSEIATVLKLILLLPATNAQSERVFSSLRRVKTYLRNSMGQGRLNHVMFMNVHKEETKKVSLEEVQKNLYLKMREGELILALKTIFSIIFSFKLYFCNK